MQGDDPATQADTEQSRSRKSCAGAQTNRNREKQQRHRQRTHTEIVIRISSALWTLLQQPVTLQRAMRNHLHVLNPAFVLSTFRDRGAMRYEEQVVTTDKGADSKQQTANKMNCKD
jgi:hypothetical protein